MSWQAIATLSSNWLFLLIVAGIPIYGYFRKVDVYDSFIEGARGGIDITVRIIPYLVAMIVAIGMFRASGALTHISHFLAPILTKLGVPADVLPMILVRPFSGAASIGVLADVANSNGGDAYASKLAATMLGGTETTFYIIAVYFGAVGITRTRYAIPAGLLAEFVGVIAAVVVTRMLLL